MSRWAIARLRRVRCGFEANVCMVCKPFSIIYRYALLCSERWINTRFWDSLDSSLELDLCVKELYNLWFKVNVFLECLWMKSLIIILFYYVPLAYSICSSFAWSSRNSLCGWYYSRWFILWNSSVSKCSNWNSRVLLLFLNKTASGGTLPLTGRCSAWDMYLHQSQIYSICWYVQVPNASPIPKSAVYQSPFSCPQESEDIPQEAPASSWRTIRERIERALQDNWRRVVSPRHVSLQSSTSYTLRPSWVDRWKRKTCCAHMWDKGSLMTLRPGWRRAFKAIRKTRTPWNSFKAYVL